MIVNDFFSGSVVEGLPLVADFTVKATKFLTPPLSPITTVLAASQRAIGLTDSLLRLTHRLEGVHLVAVVERRKCLAAEIYSALAGSTTLFKSVFRHSNG